MARRREVACCRWLGPDQPRSVTRHPVIAARTARRIGTGSLRLSVGGTGFQGDTRRGGCRLTPAKGGGRRFESVRGLPDPSCLAGPSIVRADDG